MFVAAAVECKSKCDPLEGTQARLRLTALAQNKKPRRPFGTARFVVVASVLRDAAYFTISVNGCT